MGEYLWTEIYRPSKIEDCILPARIKDSFLEYVKQGKVPNLMLTGGPGIGKTTSAIAMCEEIGLSYMMILDILILVVFVKSADPNMERD
jgi:DNA replication protein DnaC